MTTIEWTDVTWNPVTGCTKISPGCKHCYAEQLHAMRHRAHLNGHAMPQQYAEPFERVQCWPNRLEIPLGWRAPRLCFVNSMSDLFHEDVPFDFISQILFRMTLTPHITYQVLTKRASRMLEYFTGERWKAYGTIAEMYTWPLPNLWLGVSVECKKYLGRIDILRQVPASVHMVSFEPLLEDLTDRGAQEVNLRGIGWAIVGGESGRRKDVRPFEISWANHLRIQCKEQGVPFFMKQWGSDARSAGQPIAYHDPKGGDPAEWPPHLRLREFPKPYPGHQVVRMARKKVAA